MIENIEQVERIAKENKVDTKDISIFYNFWSKVDIKDNSEECWNWTKGCMQLGYGAFWLYDNNVLSHRMAYALTKGLIPEGLQVQHICNNRKCCNPNHLELGDQFTNIQYRNACDRQSRGENNGNSKLTEIQVREIHKIFNEQRKLHPGWKQWKITEPIAQKFDIHKSTVQRIILGQDWHHIYEEIRNIKNGKI